MRLTEYEEQQETDGRNQNKTRPDQTDEYKARQRVYRKQTESRKHTESIQN